MADTKVSWRGRVREGEGDGRPGRGEERRGEGGGGKVSVGEVLPLGLLLSPTGTLPLRTMAGREGGKEEMVVK